MSLETIDLNLAAQYQGPRDKSYTIDQISNLTFDQVFLFAFLFGFDPKLNSLEVNRQRIYRILFHLQLISPPSCQIKQDPRKDSKKKRCQAALLDNQGNILIIFEKSFPIELRKWGLPKGKFKLQEETIECIQREVCEEIGIDLTQYSTQISHQGPNRIIRFNVPVDQIYLYLGPEILEARWVNLKDLKADVQLEEQKIQQIKDYSSKYNMLLRRFVPKIQS